MIHPARLWLACFCIICLTGVGLLWPARAADLPPARGAYVSSGSLDSPHATQAAAADAQFVYAISSTGIARYDRVTGKEQGQSKGQAEHLNCGFLWQGKLYFAHSNYPKQPHQSDLRVLDPKTLELTVFHVFADPPGSLTWAVRQGNAWWCHFAHYGKDNHRSVLVRYDNDWKETGRWTYPADLVADWGSYSLSGGIWHGDYLLATGHDKKVIYRLQVPKEGKTVEVIEAIPAPFPGQGIAVDLKTGGLVGIDRGQRWVVFAEFMKHDIPGIRAKQRLTILSANDGQVHRRPNPDAKADKKVVTPDSITVIHLGPDHPPIVKTVYETVPNTIAGAPYMAMTGDGRYGFVTSRSGTHEPEAPDIVSVIDLADGDLKVVQTVKLPNPKMALMHPDGRRLLVPCDTGIQVFEMRAGKLELLKDNPTDFRLGSIAITAKGDRIAAAASRKGEKSAVHVFRYKDGVIEHQSEVKIQKGLPDWDGPFAFRFTPDGRRLDIPNGSGNPSKGKLDAVLIADMTLDPPTVTEAVPQVADGIASVAIHPSGKFAVLSCLEDSPRAAVHQANSHLAVVDLTAKPVRLLYHLPVESLPEGMEFTPDGTQLFVQLTYAHRIAFFDVDGFLLKRSPFVLRIGHGPSSMAIGPRFVK